jgi:DNA-binding XRE family transcriptional regulator
MEKTEFAEARHYLGRTQNQLARLLCVSPKAIQSFEQGWRLIPPGIERQLLFLEYLENTSDTNAEDCWEIQHCPLKWRKNCISWELKAGRICWFVNGTFCRGEYQGDWAEKIRLCRQCGVFGARIPGLAALTPSQTPPHR